MKVARHSAMVMILLLLIVSSSPAQADGLTEITVVAPADSIARAIKPMLPYQIDLGNHFQGKFWVQSIEHISIKKDRIFFSSLITGKDLKYATKIGKQTINFVVGKVNLANQWEVAIRFDKSKRRLFLKPMITTPTATDDLSQGDALLNTLLAALSGQEYPVELNNLKPVKTELHNQLLILNTDVSDVYAADGQLFIELVPRIQIDDPKK